MLTAKSKTGDVTFPSEWSEVTLRQFLKLKDCSTLQSILECLASNETALRSLPDDNTDYRIFNALQAYLSNPLDFATLPVPQTVLGVNPPTDIGHGTLLQKWDAERWLDDLREEHKPEGDDDQPDDQRYALPYTLATVPLLSIYLSPGLTGQPYDGATLARSVQSQIEELPVTVALPLGAFFLRRRLSLSSSGMVSLQVSKAKPLNSKLLNWLYQKLTGLLRIFRLRP